MSYSLRESPLVTDTISGIRITTLHLHSWVSKSEAFSMLVWFRYHVALLTRLKNVNTEQRARDAVAC